MSWERLVRDALAEIVKCQEGENAGMRGPCPDQASKPAKKPKPQPGVKRPDSGALPASAYLDFDVLQWAKQNGKLTSGTQTITHQQATEIAAAKQGKKPPSETPAETQKPTEATSSPFGQDPARDKQAVAQALSDLSLSAAEIVADKSKREQVAAKVGATSAQVGIYARILEREEAVAKPLDLPEQQDLQPKDDSTPAESYPADLTPQEKGAVTLYTREHYLDMNQQLRETGKVEPRYSKIDKALQSAFAKVKPFPKPVKVSRGVELQGEDIRKFLLPMVAAAKAGQPISMGGYLSTSVGDETPSAARKFNVQLKINAVHGLDAQPVSNHPYEKEMLLDHNSQFKVRSIKKNDRGGYDVELDQLPPAQPKSVHTRCKNPLQPGPCPENKPNEAKPARPARPQTQPNPSHHPVIFGAREQQHAEGMQTRLASELPGCEAIPGNAPSDMEKTNRAIRHQFEMKTLMVSKRGRLKMTAAAMARKMERLDQHPPPANVRQWTVAYDHRQAFAEDQLDQTPTFPVYIREGVGRFAIDQMHKVETAEQLEELLKTRSDKLPPAARAPTEGFYAKWQHASRGERKLLAKEAFERERKDIERHKRKHGQA